MAAARRIDGSKISDKTVVTARMAAVHTGLSRNGNSTISRRRRKLGVTIAAKWQQ